jgi:hypothetical protein
LEGRNKPAPQTNSWNKSKRASEPTQATARRLKKAVKDWEKNIEVGSKPSKPKKMERFALDKKVICQFTFRRNCFRFQLKKMPKEEPDLPFIGMDCIRKTLTLYVYFKESLKCG